MFRYQSFVYIFFPIFQFMVHHLPSFNELVNLQGLNQNSFDSTITNMGFGLTQIKHNDKWKSDRYIYILSNSKDDNSVRIERTVDSVNFGRENKLQLIITLDFIIYGKQCYNDLLSECKKNGYLLFGSNNYDREYPNMVTQEYRQGANVAKFSIGESKKENKEFYKISLSISPK